MKYNVKLRYQKNLPKLRQITVYNILNKMICHLTTNGMKKKLIKLVFNFFGKYVLRSEIVDIDLKTAFPIFDNTTKLFVGKYENYVPKVYKRTSYRNIIDNFYNFNVLKYFGVIFYHSRPLYDTKKVRKGPKYYDVPYRLRIKRSQLLTLRWFSKAVKSNNSRTLTSKIGEELEAVVHLNGSTTSEIAKLRQHVLDNLMYSHYRWWGRKKKK